MRGNPSGNFVPECEPRKEVSLEAFSIGCPKQPRRFSEQLRHDFTCPRLVCYTKVKRIVQGGN